jgi:hypothetical protein
MQIPDLHRQILFISNYLRFTLFAMHFASLISFELLSKLTVHI